MLRAYKATQTLDFSLSYLLRKQISHTEDIMADLKRSKKLVNQRLRSFAKT